MEGALTTLFSKALSLHDGTALILKGTKYFEMHVVRDLLVENHIEMSAIWLHAHKLIIMSLYRQLLGNFGMFIRILEDCLLKVFDGFLNFLKPSKERNSLVRTCESFELSQVFSDPSRVTNSSQTCIDNIFTSIDKTTVLHLHLSDHLAQKMKLMQRTPQVAKTVTWKHKINMENLNQYI